MCINGKLMYKLKYDQLIVNKAILTDKKMIKKTPDNK